jgi:hypothetical protein
MKRMFRAIIPRIIPELILLFTRMLPLACILSIIFIVGTDASYQIRSEFKLILYGILLSLAGLYLLRITSYVIWRVITGIQRIIPDIYYDESKNNKAA